MDFDTGNELETKAGVPSHDAVVTHREMMRIFDDYKETNDERLAEIERGRGDPLHRGEARAHQHRPQPQDRRAHAQERPSGARP